MMRTLVVLLALICCAGTAQATSLVIGFQDRNLDIDTGLVPTLDPIANNQTSLRATFAWDMGSKFTLIADGGWAKSFLELTDATLTGLTDLRLRGLYRPTPQWAFGAGTIVPFGLYELNSLEVTATQWTWNPRSGFPISKFGEGWGWEATAARSFVLSDRATAGLAAAYLSHAEFDYLDGGSGVYQMAPEIGLSAAMDYDYSKASRLRVVAAYTIYGSDKLNGADVVEQGNQINLSMHVNAPVGTMATAFGASATFKADNQLYQSADSTTVLSQAPGTYVGAYARLGWTLSARMLLNVEGRVLNVSGSEYALGVNGTSWSVGPGLGVRFSPTINLTARWMKIWGSGDDDLSFDGSDWLFTFEVRP